MFLIFLNLTAACLTSLGFNLVNTTLLELKTPFSFTSVNKGLYCPDTSNKIHVTARL